MIPVEFRQVVIHQGLSESTTIEARFRQMKPCVVGEIPLYADWGEWINLDMTTVHKDENNNIIEWP